MVLLDLIAVLLCLLMLRMVRGVAAFGFRYPASGWTRARFLIGAVGLSGIALYCAVYVVLLSVLYILLLWAAI